MVNKKILLLTILLSFSKLVVCQVIDKNQVAFGIGLGTNMLQIKDYCLNKSRFQGIGLSVNCFYQKTTSTTLSEVNFDFTYSKLKNRYDIIASTFSASPGISLLHTFKIKSTDKFNNYLGAKLSSGTNLTYYAMWDDSHFYWLTSTQLSIYLKTDLKLKKNQLKFSIGIPVMASISRPPYRNLNKMDKRDFNYIAKKIFSNPKIQSQNTYQNAQMSLSFNYKVSNKIEHAIKYSFEYAHNNMIKTREFHLIRHQLMFYIIIR